MIPFRFRCERCGASFAGNTPVWCCPECGGLLGIECSPAWKPGSRGFSDTGPWQYSSAIPGIVGSTPISLGEPTTPVLPIEIDKKRFRVKMEHLFPTGSYKDRGASVLVSWLHALGIPQVVEDSSGNAGTSIAAYCARASINCTIFTPCSTSPSKLRQVEAVGARLEKVDGTREDTSRKTLQVARTVFYASHSWHPLFFQGVKTFAYELYDQCSAVLPDTVVLPVGNGTLFLGAFLGFWELVEAGWAHRIPRMVAVQAKNCAPLRRAFEKGLFEPQPVQPKATLAEGIAISTPVRGHQVLRAVEQSGGEVLEVSEEEILRVHERFTSMGFFMEPTSAAGIAGTLAYMDQNPGENVVTAITGHGLKTIGKSS
ncbi:MAG TPA: pyridoxal-phosphate dependent enzyme [Thermotogota bacterium]|nr:pyridoxal-phosphate dependent enzyme [Thermotogota bacterium]HRW92864.1 pyridoxal-phosphate dependent enzyme [Thermotogota bacterium]